MSEEAPKAPPPATPRKVWVAVAALPVALVALALAIFQRDAEAEFPGDDGVAAIVRQSRKLSAFEPLDGTVAEAGDWLMIRGFEKFRVPPGLEKTGVTGGALTRRDDVPVAVLLLGDAEVRAAVFPSADLGIKPDGKPWRIYELSPPGDASPPLSVAASLSGDVCFVISSPTHAGELRAWLAQQAREP